MHLWPVGAVPLRPERRFHWEIVFVSPKTIFVCSRNTNFSKSEGIKNSKGKFFFLVFSVTYALCRAPCAIAANQKQKGKVFFLSSRLRMLFFVHLVRSRQIRNNEKIGRAHV